MQMINRDRLRLILAISGVLVIGAVFRLIGFNWGQNHHMHPDERFLTMVTTALTWPPSFRDYLDSNTSTLNPHNIGYSFYVYGTFPTILVRAIADSAGLSDYDNITLIGRVVSAVFDIGSLILVMLISHRHFRNLKTSVFSGFLYATMALPVQQSHFFTVDSILVFFLTGSVAGAVYGLPVLATCMIALAISSKISAALFLPLIIGIILRSGLTSPPKIRGRIMITAMFLPLLFYGIFRITYPTMFAAPSFFDFTPNEKLIANFRELASFDNPSGWFPPAVQWINTMPVIYPVIHIIFIGLGLIHTVTILFGLLQGVKSKNRIYVIAIILFILLFTVYQGFRFSKAMRYFYPVYPLLAVLGGLAVSKFKLNRIRNRIVFLAGISLLLIWPYMVTSIYTRELTRISASRWIYRHIPAGASHSVDSWDDSLPMTLTDHAREQYREVEFQLFGPDSTEKMNHLESNLNRTDYIFLTSNRLYGSLTGLPDKYPMMYDYYRNLFSGKLGYQLIGQFTSRPNLPVPFIRWCIPLPFIRYGIIAKSVEECSQPGISVIDDYADETWTVYDHPKVLIFKKL